MKTHARRIQIIVFTITKTNDERRQVFGWANVSITKDGRELVDLHGDVIAPDELEKASYVFVKEYRAAGEMHDRGAVKGQIGTLIASLVFTPEINKALGLAADAVQTGWFVGFELDAASFEKVKSGEYKMFSIQGSAYAVEA